MKLHRRSTLLALIGCLSSFSLWRTAALRDEGLVLRNGWLMRADDR